MNSYVVVIYIYVGPQDLMLELDKRKLVVNLKPNNKRQRVIIQWIIYAHDKMCKIKIHGWIDKSG